MARWAGAVVILSVLLFISFKLWERSHHLSFVPDGLSVSRILYVKEESWGFGPGANESGLIVYELPDNVAKEIQKAGIDYFAKMPQNAEHGRGRRGRYNKWQSTPILLE